MDSRPIDRLARAFAARASRRHALSWLAARLAAAPEFARAQESVARKSPCHPVGTACKRHHAPCCRGAACQSKTCVCKAGKGKCGDGCISFGNCAAGNACDPNDTGDRDVCTGVSTCTGIIDGQPVCCGISGVHRCGGPGEPPAEFCCSGICGDTGVCSTR